MRQHYIISESDGVCRQHWACNRADAVWKQTMTDSVQGRIGRPRRQSGFQEMRSAAIVLLSLLIASSASAQAPDWQVNPSNFESNMSVAAALWIDGSETTNVNDIVAAFAGDEVRGVTGPVDSGSGLRFFLTVYSDAPGEVITFKAYVAAEDRVFDLAETTTFAANGIVGTVSDPFILSTTTLGSCSRGRPGWSVNPPDFESNMSVTAEVTFEGVLSGDAGDLLAAFVDTDVRGVASPTDTPSGQAFFLTVYSNTSGEDISFVAYDALNDLVIPVAESLAFVPNAIHGHPGAPFAMTASCELTSTAVDSPDTFLDGSVSAYPNPFRDAATLDFQLSTSGAVTIELVDLLGRRVWRTTSDRLPAGRHQIPIGSSRLASGVYVYRVTFGMRARFGTITVTR